MELKICTRCKIKKELKFFKKRSDSKIGYRSHCRDCTTISNKNYYEKTYYNKKLYYKNRYIEKREHILYTCKIYRDNNKDKTRRYLENKRKNDYKYKLISSLRRRLLNALKSKQWTKNTHFSQYIGCTKDQLITYMESRFISGMTWDNHGEWHIDHIIPLSSAKDEQELYKLCHYTNLQPLWAKDNLSKGCKIVV